MEGVAALFCDSARGKVVLWMDQLDLPQQVPLNVPKAQVVTAYTAAGATPSPVTNRGPVADLSRLDVAHPRTVPGS
jgi:hypothetical protein